jgi:hypothetical protein
MALEAPPIERFFRMRCCWDRSANVMCKQCDINVKDAVEADSSAANPSPRS